MQISCLSTVLSFESESGEGLEAPYIFQDTGDSKTTLKNTGIGGVYKVVLKLLVGTKTNML